MKILILGINGFIGSNLAEYILQNKTWEIYGIDINNNNIQDLISLPRFNFIQGCFSVNHEWVKEHIKKCDIILPLIAIATPRKYVKETIKVFEIDFEFNLQIIRWVSEYKKRLIFPSTSEVYGISDDEEFIENKTNLVYGPIHKTRWIYGCSKQLLERVIYSYGKDYGLRYTCIRLFNWIGPRLDTIESARLGNSRVLTTFIANLIDNKPIYLVEGGRQKRSFTDIKDGIDCLVKIFENEKLCDQQIINIGNPNNVYSIAELALITRQIYAKINQIQLDEVSPIKNISSDDFYGDGFQDILFRKPNIDFAQHCLNWKPKTSVIESVENAINYFLKNAS